MSGLNRPEIINAVFRANASVDVCEKYELILACDACFVNGNILPNNKHECTEKIVLVRGLNTKWLLVRPITNPSFKSKFLSCKDLRETGVCPRGKNCVFAHNDIEEDIWNARVNIRTIRQEARKRLGISQNLKPTGDTADTQPSMPQQFPEIKKTPRHGRRKKPKPSQESIIQPPPPPATTTFTPKAGNRETENLQTSSILAQYEVTLACQTCYTNRANFVPNNMHQCQSNILLGKIPTSNWQLIRPVVNKSHKGHFMPCLDIQKRHFCSRPHCLFAHNKIEEDFWNGHIDVDALMAELRRKLSLGGTSSQNEAKQETVPTDERSVTSHHLNVAGLAVEPVLRVAKKETLQKFASPKIAARYDVILGCPICYTGPTDFLQNNNHHCSATLLLGKGSTQNWEIIRAVLKNSQKGRPSPFCRDMKAHNSCPRHRCPFAHNKIEEDFWKDRVDVDALIEELRRKFHVTSPEQIVEPVEDVVRMNGRSVPSLTANFAQAKTASNPKSFPRESVEDVAPMKTTAFSKPYSREPVEDILPINDRSVHNVAPRKTTAYPKPYAREHVEDVAPMKTTAVPKPYSRELVEDMMRMNGRPVPSHNSSNVATMKTPALPRPYPREPFPLKGYRHLLCCSKCVNFLHERAGKVRLQQITNHNCCESLMLICPDISGNEQDLEWTLIRPRISKETRLCYNLIDEECPRGAYCQFAHSQEESKLWSYENNGHFDILRFWTSQRSFSISVQEHVRKLELPCSMNVVFLTVCRDCAASSDFIKIRILVPSDPTPCSEGHAYNPLLLLLEEVPYLSKGFNLVTDSVLLSLHKVMYPNSQGKLRRVSIRPMPAKQKQNVQFCVFSPNCKRGLSCLYAHSNRELQLWYFEMDLRMRFADQANGKCTFLMCLRRS